ncbi:response regulator transcription factor [Lachnoclostridium sp. An169]|uniref:response regulator transcription factor n=1 Tax=Lachnoclostridium sp. An169 TaxID=1965569 RepID=UPI0013A666AB|nr:response regulator transcription factor [Lachnoclostridium sp. An169]HJA67803.1 response regulator transcription factor [Candidatus Mediterraneibacter cottocaccae]
MYKILFIDDDLDFLESNRIYFTRKGFEVLCCEDAGQAVGKILPSTRLDCVILDIDMPGMDGFEICKRFRELSSTPVIFLSGLTDLDNRLQSFRSGGDDFLAKPYDITELEYRIRARIRKNENVFFSGTLTYGALAIDTDRRIISYEGRAGDFSALQFDILAFMARNPNKVFSYEQLYDQVWKTPIIRSRHNIQVAVATIRQKLSRLCNGKQYIRTVSRKGYCFSPDGE